MTLEQQLQAVDQMNGEGLEVPPNAAPVEFLMAIYRDCRQPMHRRMRAAIEAAPYCHAKLSATAILDPLGFADKLERAILRSGVRLIEGQYQRTSGLPRASLAPIKLAF
jgi:hypothetical protein